MSLIVNAYRSRSEDVTRARWTGTITVIRHLQGSNMEHRPGRVGREELGGETQGLYRVFGVGIGVDIEH